MKLGGASIGNTRFVPDGNDNEYRSMLDIMKD